MLSQPRLNLFLIIFVISLLILAKSEPLAPALYVFGDSALDNGNNNRSPTGARADYAPYGQDFPQVPLGRFTNGRTSADFLAECLGLPYPPPYASLLGPNRLNLSNQLPNINLFNPNSYGGYNYASGAGGILPETGLNLGKCYTFDEQIEMFRQTMESILSPTFNNSTKLSEHLSKSIFLVGMGTNDYHNNYFLPTSPYKLFKPDQFAQLLVRKFSRQLQRLYDLGARKIVVAEVSPIGCAPGTYARVTKLMPKGKCDEEANNKLLLFNKELPFLISNLTSTLYGSHFILAHTYSLSYDIIANPTKYGFKDSMDTCCTTWLDGRIWCIPELTPCSNSSDHVFWDAYHVTEAAYSLFAKELFHGSSLCSPINIKQLLQV